MDYNKEKYALRESNITSRYELWFHTAWRPAIGWLYFVCVLFDFVLAPTGYQIAQTIAGTTDFTQWSPLTLQGNAMFHISMLTIVGVTAYGRTQEKLKKGGVEIDNLKKDAGQETG